MDHMPISDQITKAKGPQCSDWPLLSQLPTFGVGVESILPNLFWLRAREGGSSEEYQRCYRRGRLRLDSPRSSWDKDWSALHLHGRWFQNTLWEKVGKWKEEGKKTVEPWPVWLSWLECRPIDQKVVGSIPSQDTYLGCRLGPWSGHKRQVINVSLSHRCFSLCLSPFFPLSLKSIDKSSGED